MEPPYQTIAKTLRTEILAGEWDHPGEPFPGARLIGERFGVSISTASRAIQLLGAWGLVSLRDSQSALVAPPAKRPLAADGERAHRSLDELPGHQQADTDALRARYGLASPDRPHDVVKIVEAVLVGFRYVPPSCPECGLPRELVRKFNGGNPIIFYLDACDCGLPPEDREVSG